MSSAYVDGYKENFLWSLGMLEKFIKVCPEEVWKGKHGGFLVGQEAYHILAVIDFFIDGINEPGVHELFSADFKYLLEELPHPPAQGDIADLCPLMKERALNFFNSLSDETLLHKHAGLSQRIGADTNYSKTAFLLGSHILYHLGNLDGALRDAGLKGVW